MNINLQTLALAKRNTLANDSNSVGTQIPEELKMDPEKKDGEVLMNSLEIQGKNNMAFQGRGGNLITSVKGFGKNVAQKAKNYTGALMLGGMLLAGAPMMTGCAESYAVSNVDFSSISNLVSSLEASIDLLRAENNAANQQLIALLTNLLATVERLEADVDEGIASMQQFREQLMAYIEASRAQFLAVLQAQGLSLEQANARLDAIIALISSGNHDLSQIVALLTSIDSTLNNFFNEFVNWRDEYRQNEQEKIQLMQATYQNGVANTNAINQMNATLNEMKDILNTIKLNTTELLLVAQDPTRFNELISRLDSNTAELQGFRALVEMMGMNFESFMNQCRNDANAARQELLNAIQTFQNTYLQNETHENNLLTAIYNKLDQLAEMPNLPQGDIAAALAQLTQAIQNNTGVVQQGFDNLDAKITQLLAKLDLLNNKVTSIDNKMDECEVYHNTSLAHLSNMANNMELLAGYSQNNGAILQMIRNDVNNIKTNSNLAITYLPQINQGIIDVEAAINNLNAPNFTVQEFIDGYGGVLRQILTEYNINPQTMPELLQALRTIAQATVTNAGNTSSLVSYVETVVLPFIQNGQFDQDNDRALLEEIIRILRAHVNSGGSNEGVTDLDQILGGLN